MNKLHEALSIAAKNRFLIVSAETVPNPVGDNYEININSIVSKDDGSSIKLIADDWYCDEVPIPDLREIDVEGICDTISEGINQAKIYVKFQDVDGFWLVRDCFMNGFAIQLALSCDGDTMLPAAYVEI